MQSSAHLERVSVESPCSKRWSELVGDPKRRYCSSCDLHVTNLSALGRDEAEEFLGRSQGRVCVTYVPGERGGAASRDELAMARHRWSLRSALTRAAGLVLSLAFLVSGCRPAPAQPARDLDRDGPGPEVDPVGDDDRRVLGAMRADPSCVVDDDRLVMGEATWVEPETPPVSAGDRSENPDG